METFLQDLTHSLRMFRRSPGFTLTAIAALALGIGANTAIFSVVNTVLLKPVGFVDPDRVVMFVTLTAGEPMQPASETKFNVWRQQSAVIQDVTAYRFGIVNLTGGDLPEQLPSMYVTGDFFRLSGLPIVRGRAFANEEERANGNRAVLISEELWKRRFAGDPGIVGRSISINSGPREVIGIVAGASTSELGPAPGLWLPLTINPSSGDHRHYFSALGRLKPGVTLEMANAQLQLATGEFRRRFPTAGDNVAMGPKNSFGVRPLRDALVGNVRFSLVVLLGAVSLVLLIACANVANLLLVRATGRKREIAIRAAVGAGRSRLLRQLLTENVTLSLAGGVLGLLLGTVGIRAILAMSPGNIPRIGEHAVMVTLDWRVLIFTLVVSLATAILFGVVPAFEGSRTDPGVALKEGGGRSGSGFRQELARSLLVVSEVALAVVLLVGAALLIRTFAALRGVNPGFDRHFVLTMRMSLAEPRFERTSNVAELMRDGLQRLKALPGVTAVAAAQYIPLEAGATLPLVIAGRPLNDYSRGAAHWRNVSPGFFEAFKIPILRGRAFTESDDSGTPVVIINQALARILWPKSDPLVDRLIIGVGVGSAFADPARQIIGIAGDVHDDGLNRSPAPTVYVPIAQVSDGLNAILTRGGTLAWVVRTRAEPHSLIAPVQNELRQASGGLPVGRIRTMDDLVEQSTARQDFNALVLTIFGVAALLLASIGIYGVIAFSVQQRTREIGIRLALGAQPGGVRNMVMLQGMRLALAGIVIGLAAAGGFSRVITTFLFGVKALDPLVFATVPVFLSVVALVAVWIPARRASRIDPIHALRYE